MNEQPSWKNRRKVLFITLLFNMFCISYIMILGEDNNINEVIVMWSFILSGTCIGSYVFGATWQDINLHKR